MSKMNIEQAMKQFEMVRNFISSQWSIFIPSPNKDWKKMQEAEAKATEQSKPENSATGEQAEPPDESKQAEVQTTNDKQKAWHCNACGRDFDWPKGRKNNLCSYCLSAKIVQNEEAAVEN